MPLVAIASSLIFATPIKNVALYGNPFDPTKVAVAGIVINHKAVPETYSEGDRPQKWLRSVLEINNGYSIKLVKEPVDCQNLQMIPRNLK